MEGVEEIEADFVIIGAGAVGIPAAIRAAQAGKRVVVLEKNGYIGGNMLVSDGRLDVPLHSVSDDARSEMTDSLEQYYQGIIERAKGLGYPDEMIAKVQAAHDEWSAAGNTTVFDCPEWYTMSDEVQDGTAYDPEYADWSVRSRDNKVACAKWYYEEMGAELENPIIGIAGCAWSRSSRVADTAVGEGLIDCMDKFINDNSLDNIEFLMSTAATEILMENGEREAWQ